MLQSCEIYEKGIEVIFLFPGLLSIVIILSIKLFKEKLSNFNPKKILIFKIFLWIIIIFYTVHIQYKTRYSLEPYFDYNFHSYSYNFDLNYRFNFRLLPNQILPYDIKYGEIDTCVGPAIPA